MNLDTIPATLREKGLCQEVLALVPETTGRYLQTEFKRIQ